MPPGTTPLAGKPKENSANTNPTSSPERAKAEQLKTMSEKLKKLRNEVLASRRNVKTEGVKDTSEIKREILQEELLQDIDVATAEKIAAIDPSKESKYQEGYFQALKIVSYTLLPKLFAQGIKKEEIENFGTFKTNLEQMAHNKRGTEEITLNGTEEIALQKIEDISATPKTPLFQEMNGEKNENDKKFIWKKFVEEIHKIYEKTAAFKRKFVSTEPGAQTPSPEKPEWIKGRKKTPESPSEKKDEPKSWYGKIFSLITENPKTTLLLAAGAYGIYKIFLDGDDSKKAESEPTSLWGKITHGIWENKFALGVLVLGALLGPKIANTYFSEQKMQRVKELCEKGEITAALRAFIEDPDSNWGNYQKITEAISKESDKKVRAETLKKIAFVGYQKFISPMAEGKGVLSEGFRKSGVVDSIPGGNMVLDELTGSPQQIAEEKIIRDYLNKHSKEIEALNFDQNATVLDVLSKLQNVEVAPGTAKKAAEKAAEGDSFYDIGNGEVVGFSKKVHEDMLEGFKNKPHIHAVIKKYEGKEGIVNAWEYMSDLIDACKEDHVSLIVGAGKVALYSAEEGGKMVFLSSTKHMFNAAMETVKCIVGDGSGWIVAKEYLWGSAPCIVVGAITNTILSSKSSLAMRFMAGGAKGITYPVQLTKYGILGAVGASRRLKKGGFEVQELWHRNDPVKLEGIKEARARYYSERVQWYQDMHAPKSGIIQPKKWWARLDPKRTEALYIRYLNEFAEAYNDLHPKANLQHVENIDGNAATEIKAKMNEFITKQKADGKWIEKVTPREIPRDEAKLMKSEGTGPTQKHSYKFLEQEIELTQSEIDAKVTEIAAKKTAPTDANQLRDWNADNIKEAEKYLCREKLYTPTEITKAGKTNLYRYMGQELEFPQAEIDAKTAKGISKADAIQELCVERSLKGITIDDARIKNGKYEYKMKGEWISGDTPTEPAKAADLKSKFVGTLKEKGIIINFEEYAKKSTGLKFLSWLEKMMGPTAAILTIYKLDTATDKRKAVSEVAAGFATYMAGEAGRAKLLERSASLAGKFKLTASSSSKILAIGGPVSKILLMVGVISASYFKWDEPLVDFFEGGLKVIFGPASHGVSGELGNIVEAISYGSLARTVLASAEKGLIKKALEKQAVKTALQKPAMRAMEKFVIEKIGRSFTKKIMRFAARTGFINLIKMMGWRGAATGALLADDASVIGVLDDVIALGLVIWMGYDMIKIYCLIKDAYKVKENLEANANKKITRITGGDKKSTGLLVGELAKIGLTIDQIGDLSDDQVQGLFHSFQGQTVKIEINREGVPGREVWIIKNGEAVGISIYDASGKEYASISDDDAKEMDEAMASLEKEEKGDTPKVSRRKIPESESKKVSDLPPPSESMAEAA